MTRTNKHSCPKCGSPLIRGRVWKTKTKKKRSYHCKNDDCDFKRIIEEELITTLNEEGDK